MHTMSLHILFQQDNTTKRPAVENVNESCKRQRICVRGSETPSILSALTNVDQYPNNKSLRNGK